MILVLSIHSSLLCHVNKGLWGNNVEKLQCAIIRFFYPEKLVAAAHGSLYFSWSNYQSASISSTVCCWNHGILQCPVFYSHHSALSRSCSGSLFSSCLCDASFLHRGGLWEQASSIQWVVLSKATSRPSQMLHSHLQTAKKLAWVLQTFQFSVLFWISSFNFQPCSPLISWWTKIESRLLHGSITSFFKNIMRNTIPSIKGQALGLMVLMFHKKDIRLDCGSQNTCLLIISSMLASRDADKYTIGD